MDKIPEFTILSEEQCFGRKSLKLFKEIGAFAETTFAPCSRSNGVYGAYWTKSNDMDEIIIVDYDGEAYTTYPDDRSIGCRLAIYFDEKVLSISNINYISANVKEFKLDCFGDETMTG